MNDASISHAQDDAARTAEGRPPEMDGAGERSEDPWLIALAATFTADPLRQPLKFWMNTLAIRAEISVAPYGQLLQQLFDPRSLLSQNTWGCNVLLLRLDDWIRDRTQEDLEQNLAHVRATAAELVTGIERLRSVSSAPLFILFCPSSAHLASPYVQPLAAIERELAQRLRAFDGVHLWDHAELTRLYPVASYGDARADRIAHIPYTTEYFAAAATLLARRAAALLKPACKVIALDCDNTLWRGICGEEGPEGVELTPAHLELQRLLVRQHDAGVLLCLCSKNNISDVEAVFAAHLQMPLRMEHLVALRVNWSSKSSNLQSLAAELDLGLDGFILIDDSEMECAEVRANCPAVRTLRLPQTQQEIMHFLDHVWAFDPVGVTAESRRRTAHYRENRARAAAREASTDLESFLASLQLRIDVAPMGSEHVARVAELVQRTNQFNFTTLRRRAPEIEMLRQTAELRALIVHVRDRFGDYGLVGAVFYRHSPPALDVDTLLLSCRVLGRGVEHRVVNELARIARQEGLTQLVLRYRQSSRNVPAWEFLHQSFGQYRLAAPAGAEQQFIVPVEYAATVGTRADGTKLQARTGHDAGLQAPAIAADAWLERSFSLSRLPDLMQALAQSAARTRGTSAEYIAPRTSTEAAIAALWSEVLGVDSVGVRDDFFDSGGDSLLAVQVIARIGSVLGLELPLHHLFEGPTVEALAERLADASPLDMPIARSDRRQQLPLSWSQQRLWFIDQLERGSTAYHIPVALRLDGELRRDALGNALQQLVERHEALRTTFATVGGEPVQVIHEHGSFALQFCDVSASADQEAAQRDHAREELAAVFDLGKGPLIRGRLLQLSASEHVLLIVAHHMVADGWSIGILVRELVHLYAAAMLGRRSTLPDLQVQYADYAQWQRRWLADERLERQVEYWCEHLRGAPELLELPTDRPRPPTQSYRGAGVRIALGRELTAELKTLARKLNLTLAMMLYAAWSIVLSRLSGQDDIVVGMPVANRRRAELEGLIGYFVNTLAVRIRLDDDPCVIDLLERTKALMVDAYAHQDAPFERVVEALRPARSLSHSPIFQVMLVLQNAQSGVLQLPDLQIVEEDVPLHTAQFDLLLSLRESTDGLRGTLGYASDLFDAATAERWLSCFECVLQAVVRSPHLPVSKVPLLSAEQRRQVVESFNALRMPFPEQTTIDQLIEQQVRRSPDAVALIYEGQSLSYAQLNERANQLARHLRQRGVAPGQLVAICVERSVEMVVGLLGVLKAGGAYVPLDPNYPPERLQYMLDDAAPKVLLTQAELHEKAPQSTAEVIALDRDWQVIARQPAVDLDPTEVCRSSRDLAYVIYTSGSTGKPKGAMNEHRAVVNRLLWMQQQYGLGGHDRVLQKTPFSFDVSVWEFFWPLLTGACLVVARPRGHQDPQYLRALIEQTCITTLHFVPSMLQLFLDAHRAGQCPSLRHVVCSGEELPAALTQKFFECLPQARLSNLYGPTEAAIDVTFWECQAEWRSSRVPIGQPIANVQMYVLDAHLQPVPIGVTGEVYIGGIAVGRGYLNRAELTAQRFIPDPFSADSAARLYKTGDLGRWRSDGTIEYLGRNDHQVKLRGFRIELGEIETQLLRDRRVKEAVVVAREDEPAQKRLVAYIVPAEGLTPGQVPEAEELRAGLQPTLPDYMIPSAFVLLDRMPLSPNGKLERCALPAPGRDAYASRRYEPPRNEVEEALSKIWSGLLQVEQIGRQDNFFELGGHSLLIVQMLERLRRVGLAAQLRDVFERPSLAELAAVIVRDTDEARTAPRNSIPVGCTAISPAMVPLVELTSEHIARIVRAIPGGAANIQDIYPLAPLQEGILFHHLLMGQHGDTYVVPTVLSVASRADLDALIAALQFIIDRHDVLRTSILWEELPVPLQIVQRQARLAVEEVALDPQRDRQQQIAEWTAPRHQRLDLRQAPLLRLKVARDERGGDQWCAVLQFHHIIGDNTSQETAIAEVVAHLEGRAHTLPDSVPYRDHVAQALAHARTQDPEAFFRSKLQTIDEPTAPFGLLDVHGDGALVAEACEDLEPALVQRARAQARSRSLSVAALFHAAWSLVVARTSGRDDVVFGSVLSGRLQGAAGAQHTLGMFINTLPLRLCLADRTAAELVEHTQRELAALLSYEQSSLAMAQRCSSISGSAPLFTALLNYRRGATSPQARWSRAPGISVLTTHERTNYPITLSLDDLDHGLTMTAQSDQRIDPRRVIGYMRTSVQSLVQALEDAPQSAALSLAVLPDDEHRQVTEIFNSTTTRYPRDRSIHELFEAQVERAPQAVAVAYDEQVLTYAELNRAANRLARYLVEGGAAPGEYIPVLMARSARMVIAQLAVLKCGGAYVPIDPELPAERRAFMIRDCGARRIVAEGAQPVGLDIARAVWVDYASLDDGMSTASGENLFVHVSDRAPAYVMYTSGSTGLPKGVIVPHGAVNRLAINNGYAEMTPDDCIAHYSNPAFDASTFEIWGGLLTGAKVAVVAQRVVLDAPQFARVLTRHGVTMLYMSVGLFNQYTDALAEVFRRLRYLLVGGDALEPGAIKRVLVNSPPQRLLNAYGPTECTTFATTYTIESVADAAVSIPIGRPMANAQIYILDARGQPVPIGVPGEMYIGGAGVACGYLNRPELTAERFLPDPFSAAPDARLYRTGDLARWRADGAVEFLGRNDLQVKIRGFRIELGEIEARLVRHEGIKEVVVLARRDGPGERSLVAYFVPTPEQPAPGVEELRGYVRSALPDYMVPAAFVALEQMPLNSSGKVDRRALPAPLLAAYVSREYEAPRGEVEEILAGIWQSVLGVERIGRHDNFFELGGHSLLIVQLMERLRRVGLVAEVRSVFASPTLVDLASALTTATVEQFAVPPNLIPPECAQITPRMLPLVDLEQQQIELIVQSVPGGACNVHDIYPLAPLQEGILFHHLLDEGGSDTYVLPTVLSVASSERLHELIAALQVVVDRHEVLRTAVLWEGLPRAVQVVYRQAALPVEEASLDPHRDAMAQIAEWIRPERQRLDIRRAPLLRLRIAADPCSSQWYVLLQLHHMTIDHVALEIITSEVVAHLEGRAQQLPDCVPYRNHVAQSLAYERTHDASAFFRAKLGDVDEPTAPFGLLDVHGDGTQIDDAHEIVEPVLAARVRSHARRLGVSAATLFHAAWAMVVAHTSGRSDVVFGSVLLGRLQGSAGAGRTLGMFINTLPLRLQLTSATVGQFVEQTQRELVELLGHEQASLAVAQRCSGVAGSTPLFSALLNFRHSVPNSAAEWASASGIRVLASQERTNYPITLSVDDLGEGFTLKAQVDRRVAASRVTSYLHTALRSLVAALEGAPSTPVLGLSILPPSEQRQVMQFNATRAACPSGVLIHQLFEAQARRTPDAAAVEHGPRSLTYAELNRKANQLARHLRTLGVGSDQPVGICVDRSPEMVIGLLAILKAGGAYLPLDPNYPPERIAYMLLDAAPRVVLTEDVLQRILPPSSAHKVVLETGLQTFAAADTSDLPPDAAGLVPESLLYVIYTSGSTGQPKGIAMPHRAMVNLIEWHRRTFGALQPRVLQFAALSFDVAFQETFSTLCVGGTLVLLDECVRRDTAALLELLNEQRIERLFVPPLMLQSLAEYCKSARVAPTHLRDVITAGEQLRISPEIVELFRQRAGCRLHNHYGPTETHVVTSETLAEDPRDWPQLPTIGRPIANTQIHLLDARRQPVPIGTAAEIYIAGANVARGYLHRGELTAERFVRDPFRDDADACMYRTGDLGRWCADGTIEYLGRNDDQVKIRGYRIELGEIEARLARHALVREAAVVAREDVPGQKRLVAYVTHQAGCELSVEALSSWLKETLPEYMVPSAFVVLDRIPLTPSGKLNRRALPAPAQDAYASREYVAPRGAAEVAVANVWREVLGVERVGREDSFFDLGGHSLLALKAVFRLNQVLGCTLRVADAYRNPLLRDLAARIDAGSAEDELVDLQRESALDRDIVARPGRRSVPAKSVLLTGATGFVGRFLLAQLLKDTDATIYCLVRARTKQQANARLRTTLLRWDLWRDEDEARIVALPCDLRLQRLGMDDVTHAALCRSIDSIYHCATSMNHLETYAMAKPANVDATRELLRLATSHRPKVIHYVSTLGVFSASLMDTRRVVSEETPIEHEVHRGSQGYTASKWVSEKMFLNAAQRGIPCNVFRLGLVWADAQQGRFDELQSVYRVLKSCLLSGYGIEGYRYPMPPTPVDYVARAIVLLGERHCDGGGIFHISSSDQMTNGVFERCRELIAIPLKLLPYYDWICEMKRQHQSGLAVPAAPLIEFAFSMDQQAFAEHLQRTRSAAHVRFDMRRTQDELIHAGVVAPALDDDLLRVCLEGMLARDHELQGLTNHSETWLYSRRGPDHGFDRLQT